MTFYLHPAHEELLRSRAPCRSRLALRSKETEETGWALVELQVFSDGQGLDGAE